MLYSPVPFTLCSLCCINTTAPWVWDRAYMCLSSVGGRERKPAGGIMVGGLCGIDLGVLRACEEASRGTRHRETWMQVVFARFTGGMSRASEWVWKKCLAGSCFGRLCGYGEVSFAAGCRDFENHVATSC